MAPKRVSNNVTEVIVSSTRTDITTKIINFTHSLAWLIFPFSSVNNT